jgi:hypothetical protein
MSGHAQVDLCSSPSWFQGLERRIAKLEVTVEKLQSANALAPVPLPRVASGPPVYAAPAGPATPAAAAPATRAAAAPATRAAVDLASPSTSVVTVKEERLKYASKKAQRPVLDNTQRVGLEALEKWFKDTPALRAFLIKCFHEWRYTVKNSSGQGFV